MTLEIGYVAWTPRLGSNQGYLSTDEVDTFIDDIVASLPPALTRIENLGKTLGGRQLRALCLGACQVGSDAPQALYTGMHHSREVRLASAAFHFCYTATSQLNCSHPDHLANFNDGTM